MSRMVLAVLTFSLALTNGTPPVVAQEPATQYVAFRFDDQHVIAVVKDSEMADLGEKISPSAKPAAQYGFPYVDAGPARLAQVAAPIASAKRWIVDVAPGLRVEATAEQVVAGQPSCTEALGVLLTIDPRQQSAFAAQTSLYFVATPALDSISTPTPGASKNIGLASNTLSPDQRQALETLLAGVLTRELPGVQKEAAPDIARMAESTVNYHRSWARARRSVDAGLAKGRGRLTYDLQAFHLEPDAPPLYFVRAEWRVEGRVAFGAALWIRGGPTFAVVDQDLSPARWVRMFEFQGDVGRAQYGLVLNVLDRNGDGWGEILFAHGGYEGFGIQLLERTPTGWVPAGASYSYGC
ncbi:MAG: hypothetical protein ABI665_12415 [Vicinamibacterales bacterium]